jgi:hypothetical protein
VLQVEVASRIRWTPPRPSTAGAARRGSEDLLVEDEVGARELSREIPEAHGYRVLEAHDPAETARLFDELSGPFYLSGTW